MTFVWFRMGLLPDDRLATSDVTLHKKCRPDGWSNTLGHEACENAQEIQDIQQPANKYDLSVRQIVRKIVREEAVARMLKTPLFDPINSPLIQEIADV